MIGDLTSMTLVYDPPPLRLPLRSALPSFDRPGLGYVVDLDVPPSETTPLAVPHHDTRAITETIERLF